MAHGHDAMNEAQASTVRVDLQRAEHAWHVVIERDGQRREVGSIDELIRFLRDLAALPERRRHGLR